MSTHLGEIAALGAATAWVFSSLFFTMSGRRVGALMVNRTRLVFAVLLVGVMHWLLRGRPFPTDAEPFRYLWLGLSAVVGLVIGDTFLFQCYVMVGTRIGVLMFVLGPLFSALLSWVFLHEALTAKELIGMALVLAGVLWVVLKRQAPAQEAAAPPRQYGRGILYGALSQVCQAGNLVLAKQGLVGGFPALSGVMIRMTAGMVVMWLLALLTGQAGRTIRALRADRRAAAMTFGGAFVGPFLGVWMSMAALQASAIGVASTLMSLTPVLSLPVVRFVLKERISPAAILGTLVAMAGVALMVLF